MEVESDDTVMEKLIILQQKSDYKSTKTLEVGIIESLQNQSHKEVTPEICNYPEAVSEGGD